MNKPSPSRKSGGVSAANRKTETTTRSQGEPSPAFYASALDPEEVEAYLQALGLDSLRDEAALIRAKLRSHIGDDDRRELPLLLKAIEVLMRVVHTERAASKSAPGARQDLANIVEAVLADLDGV